MQDGYTDDYSYTINKDPQERALIPAGTYAFRVGDLTRTRSAKSDNPMVRLRLVLEMPDGGTESAYDNLVITPAAEWRLAEFFTSIGQKRKGVPMRIDWSTVAGSTGVVVTDVEVSEQYGSQTRIKRYLDPASAECLDFRALSLPRPPAAGRAAPAREWKDGVL